jgi:hypothetical protein
MTTLRVKFDGRVLVPQDPVDLPVDRILEIDVRDEPLRTGSPEALQHFLKTSSRVPAEDIKAMMDAINEASQPPDYRGAFDDLLTADGQ